jgi:hypothetical protein
MHTMNMLGHLRAVRDYTQHHGIKAELRMSDLHLEVSGHGRYYDLVPGFLRVQPSENYAITAYQAPVPGSSLFSGWRLHPLKDWPLATDKIAFKKYCAEHGLASPRWFTRPSAVDCPIVIKSHAPGQRLQTRGPVSAAHAQALPGFGDGSYAEELVRGHMLQLWYWDDVLTACELRTLPVMVGPARESIRAALSAHRPPLNDGYIARVEASVRAQGATLDAVLEPGQEIILDVRAESPLARTIARNEATTILTALASQLRSAGPLFSQGIPADMRQHTLFTVNAIVDAQRKIWFTEMESNPVVHPEAYPAMLGGLFGTAVPLPAFTQPPPAASTSMH